MPARTTSLLRLFVLSPLVLAACASVAPPAAEPLPAATVPAAWSRTNGEATAAASWSAFGDPLLTALVRDALAANLDLKSAGAALAQARAQRDVVAAGRSLQVGSSASAGRNRSGGRYGNSLQAGLDASWEADVFGRLGNATAAAQAQAEASAMTLEATRLAIAGETAIAYLQWLGTKQQLAIATESVTSQQQTLQIVQWRVQAGLASALDEQQAEANLEQTRSQLPALQTTLAQTENALAILLGQPPASLAQRLAAAPTTATQQPPAWPALGVPAETLRRRPDVRAAELQVSAALATLAQRQAERLPTFSISGNVGVAAASWSALGGPAAVAAGIAAAVSWPLLDGGAAKAQVAAQQAALDGARYSYQAAALTALQDVEDNLTALANGRDKVDTLARASDAAAAALQLARHRYSAGLIDFGTLLDSERSRLSADSSLASARTDLLLAHVRLVKALGGGWADTNTASAS